jgi:hypothetical protein
VDVQVTTASGEEGVIESSFGKSGKQKVFFPQGVAAALRASEDGKTLKLRCKRYVFDPKDRKRFQQ